MVQKAINFVLCILLASCNNEVKRNEVRVEITGSNEFRVNGDTVPEEKLQQVLFDKKTKLIELGIKESEIIVILIASERAKVRALSRLEEILRKLSLKKIRYESISTVVT